MILQWFSFFPHIIYKLGVCFLHLFWYRIQQIIILQIVIIYKLLLSKLKHFIYEHNVIKKELLHFILLRLLSRFSFIQFYCNLTSTCVLCRTVFKGQLLINLWHLISLQIRFNCYLNRKLDIHFPYNVKHRRRYNSVYRH